MKKIAKLLVLVYALFAFTMIGNTLAQSASISLFDAPRVICKTAKFGVPSVYLEWETDQLFEVEGIYSFTGRSPVSITGLSVGWLVVDHTANPKSFEVAIRTRKDEAPWMEWVRFPGDIGPGDSPSGLFWSHLYIPIDFGIHTDFEIRIQPPAGVPITFVRVVVFDNSTVPEIPEIPEILEEINPSEPVMEIAATTALGAPAQPPIISRLQWLGTEHPWNVSQIPITHAIVHHTAGHNIARTLSQSKQEMRTIRNEHIAQGFSDIGYNFVIDREGRIFQGRHNPWLSTTDVLGAHAFYSNHYSVGIALIGQFQPGEPHPTPAVGHPSELARQNLERLLTWRFHQHNLDPLGMANIATFWGIRNIHRIAGHRDVGARNGWTACPGDNLWNLLPVIRTNVRALIPPQLRVSPATVAGSLAPGAGLTTIGTVNVTNPGGGTLSWSATSNRAWLSVTPSSGTTTTETDSVTVRATAAGLGVGTHIGTITFIGASPATGTPATVRVTLTVTTAAPLASPTAIDGS